MNIINSLSDLMTEALRFFFNISGNWGVAIILLTIAVKLILYPLTFQSTKQMAAMQKIQPKIDELQKKHKEKPEEFQKQMFELYKKEGVHPLGGCLPMLLQIPVFLALFFAVSRPAFKLILAAAGSKAQFLWITNLSKPDPTFIMIALIALTTYWASATMPGGLAKQQKSMLYVMPGFIAVISMSFPAGVQLYWIVQNLLTIVQQWYILRK